MSIGIEKIGDITKLMINAGTIPNRMYFKLSEDKTFYETQLWYDFYDANIDTIRDGCIVCKSTIPSFVYDFKIVPDSDDEKIFTLTFSDEEDT